MVTASRRTRLGEWLLGEGLVTEPGLTRALAAQERVGHRLRLGGVLLASGLVTEEALLDALSRLHHCRSVGWPALSRADPAAVALLNATRAARLEAFPYGFEKKALKVAFRDPSNLQAVDEVAAVSGRRIETVVTSEVRLLQAHQKFYARALSREMSNVLKRLEAGSIRIDVPGFEKPLPPPPQFSALPEAESETDAPPQAGRPPGESPGVESLDDAEAVAFLDDPFSDTYSLNDFLADALSFGVMPESLPDPEWTERAESSRSEASLSPGEPLPGDDSEPSVNRRRPPTHPLGVAR